MKLAFSCLIGLGNPSPLFDNTKHNLGKMFVLWLIEKHKAPLRTKHLFSFAQIELNQKNIVTCVLPRDIYMNESGKIIPELHPFFKDHSHLLLAHDDLEVPFGESKLRTEPTRGARGHKGLRSIIQSLHGTKPYFLSLGIGRPSEKEISDFVLEKFKAHEKALLEDIYIKTELLIS